MISDFFQLAAMQSAWIRLLMVFAIVGTLAVLFGIVMAVLMSLVEAFRRRYHDHKTWQMYQERDQRITDATMRFIDQRVSSQSSRRAAEEDQRQRLDAIIKGRAS